MRPAQNLDPLDFAEVEGRLAWAGQHDAVEHGRHRWLDARRRGDGADAADEHGAILVRSAGAELDGRHRRRNILDIVELAFGQARAGDRRDRDRHVLNAFVAEARGDDDLAGVAAGFGLGRAVRRGRFLDLRISCRRQAGACEQRRNDDGPFHETLP